MAQALDDEIQKYLPLLKNSEKQSLRSVIRSFLSSRDEASGAISTEDYNKELDEAEAEYEQGDFISHEEMISRIKKW